MKRFFIAFMVFLAIFTAISEAKNSLFDIIPKPKEAYYKSEINKSFIFNKSLTIYLKTDSLNKYALYLNELLLELKIPNLKIKVVSSFDFSNGGIFLGTFDQELNDYANKQIFQKAIVTPKFPGKESYVIDINKDIYIINASDEQGLGYGIATFKQLIDIVDIGGSFEYYIENARIVDSPDFSIRWVYYPTNFLVDANSKPTRELWKNSAAYKLNGVYLTDVKFEFISEMQKKYSDSLASIKTYADFYNLKIAQSCMQFGYSNSILFFNPNFAEALPVVNQKFVIEKDTARLIQSKNVSLINGGFENFSSNNPDGYAFIDKPGKVSFIDTQTKHSGNASLRFEKIAENDPANGTARICAKIIADKYKMYHISGWIKTENFTPVNSFGIQVLSTITKRSYQYANIDVPSNTNGWKKIDVNFNSLDADTLFVYFAVRGGKTGVIWWDDLKIEEYNFTNLIRRESAPLKVYNKSLSVDLMEVADFDSLIDKKTGYVYNWAGEYDIFHQPPTFKINPASSKVKNGDTLLISYHHAITVYDGQVMASTTEPKLKEQIEKQFQIVNSILKPEYYFMNHDEIRVLNWENIEQPRTKSPAELIAENANWGYNMIKKYNSKAKVLDWSDMFDVYHNAKLDPYYLVNGVINGSADYLRKDIIMVNWNSGNNFKLTPISLKYFENLGFLQIAAPFYDQDQNHIRRWKEELRNSSRVLGMMYTTWTKNYNYVPHFAEYSWNHPPYLSHTPLTNDTIHNYMSFKIDVQNDKWDKDSKVREIKFYYRFSNLNKFDSLSFNGNIIDSSVVFNLKKESDFLEYYIEGFDNKGWSKRLPFNNQDYYRVGKPFTDVEEIDLNSIISPNPASDYITIQNVIPAKAGIYVEIFNILGEKVEQTSLSVQTSQTGMSDLLKIDISNLAPGVYFVKIGDRFEKFVKN